MKFTIFKNQTVGYTKYAKNFEDLKSKMTKKERLYWSHVQYKDEHGRTIQITREYLEEQKMSLKEVVQDWLQHGDTSEIIYSIN